ncbi:MAG: fimbrillin family protein, partial [Prevotella sp.]|nr:fimbrillin family protein [Prevotella sp.]
MRKYLFCAMMLFALHVQAQGYHYDVNNDGAINIADVVSLVNKLLGKPDEGDTSNNEQRKLILRVSENPLISPNGAKANKRLAPAILTNTLDHFYISMMYYSHYFDEWCNADDETYSIDTPGQYQNNEHWPQNYEVYDNESVTVFGYYTYEDRYDQYERKNGYFFLNEGNPYLQVVTEESSDDQRDVLVAKNADTWNNCKGVVNLVFNHVCAALQFSLMKTTSLTNYTVEVKEVKLHNIHNVGNYALITDKWKDVEGYSSFTLSAYKEGRMNAISVGTEETLLAKNK